jgi:hypothetical protein
VTWSEETYRIFGVAPEARALKSSETWELRLSSGFAQPIQICFIDVKLRVNRRR